MKKSEKDFRAWPLPLTSFSLALLSTSPLSVPAFLRLFGFFLFGSMLSLTCPHERSPLYYYKYSPAYPTITRFHLFPLFPRVMLVSHFRSRFSQAEAKREFLKGEKRKEDEYRRYEALLPPSLPFPFRSASNVAPCNFFFDNFFQFSLSGFPASD